MRKYALWILVAVVVIVLAFLTYTLARGVRETTEPLKQLRGVIATQMSQLFHPTPTVMPDPVTIVHEVQELARLETMQYTVEKVIIAETGQGPFGFLFGDRLLLVAHGVVIAGVDLEKLDPEDLWIDEAGQVVLRLPESEIFITSLDNEKSYVYDRDTGLLTHGDVNLEATARLAAEEEIERAALEDGILAQAQLNAENYLYRMMRSIGFPDVIFVEK
ncbi:MAG: hypothetical protein AMJ88_10840 [Anaerolineae bacterium SM23_ 63]|nr:MAG: hypothetical protein AMJ88_10840 [Anaerolineae bacterium SM23_ 63]HEY46613.1 DUF4230 domain-containing protein [Anaerolineae bacterium]